MNAVIFFACSICFVAHSTADTEYFAHFLARHWMCDWYINKTTHPAKWRFILIHLEPLHSLTLHVNMYILCYCHHDLMPLYFRYKCVMRKSAKLYVIVILVCTSTLCLFLLYTRLFSVISSSSHSPTFPPQSFIFEMVFHALMCW